jgi:hypothetical protein
MQPAEFADPQDLGKFSGASLERTSLEGSLVAALSGWRDVQNPNGAPVDLSAHYLITLRPAAPRGG